MWNESTRYAVIIRPLCVVVDDVWIFCDKSPCTDLKFKVLVRSHSSDSPRNFVRLCIWLPYLRIILIWIFSCSSPCIGYKTQTLTGYSKNPGRLDALELGAVEELATVCESRSSVGFDFVTILSSPFSSCILFVIVSGQLAELKMLMLNKWRWTSHHAWNCPLSVCLWVGFWCQCIWFGSLGPEWFCQITHQAQLCGFGIHVSLLDFCLWWQSWSSLQYLQKCTRVRRLDVWGYIIDIG